MGRVYVDTLLWIECDYCDARIRPGPDIAKSGWMQHGLLHSNGESLRWYACPKHANEALESGET